MKAVFWLGITVLMQISRLRYKQSRISMLIPQIYVLGCFVIFLVIFGTGIYRNRKFGIVLKLEFEDAHQTVVQ